MKTSEQIRTLNRKWEQLGRDEERSASIAWLIRTADEWEEINGKEAALIRLLARSLAKGEHINTAGGQKNGK